MKKKITFIVLITFFRCETFINALDILFNKWSHSEMTTAVSSPSNQVLCVTIALLYKQIEYVFFLQFHIQKRNSIFSKLYISFFIFVSITMNQSLFIKDKTSNKLCASIHYFLC